MNKLVIPPKNYWNMMWNNFVTLIFVIYCAILPLMVSYQKDISKDTRNSMLIFDILFTLDRVLDLLAGFYKPDGRVEMRLLQVLQTNLSYKIFLEIFISYGPNMMYKEV